MKQWFASLKVSQKLMLISIFFVMPDSLMLYFFITGINANIEFAELEKKGNAYQRPLEDLLELIPQHRMLAQTAGAEDQLAQKQAQIDEAFDALEAVDARLSIDLHFTDEGLAKRHREHFRARSVRMEWEELRAGLGQLPPQAIAAQHLHLVADVRMMITHAGDQSNLILDPDLDSYYLMDVTLLGLPQTQDRLAEVLAFGTAILNRQAIITPERQQLAIYATMLKEADMDRIIGSLQTALNEDANFYGSSATLQGRVPSALKEYSDANDQFISLTNHLASVEGVGVTAADYVAAGNKARATSFQLWRIASEELDKFLQTRIEYYEHRRTSSLMVAALALLAAVGFVTFITKSISGPLRRQAEELQSTNESLQFEIAGRKRTEKELRRSEAQLATAQIIARVGSWEWDMASGKAAWSDENFRIHGLEPGKQAMSHEAAMSFIHPEDRGVAETIMMGALNEGQPFSFEHRIVLPDGSVRMIHKRGEVVMAADGRAAAKVFGTSQDITERKRAEEDLKNMHKMLLDTSRQAGMAEVATGVLHNVGNVLNSMNVSTTMTQDILRQSKTASLVRIAGLLEEHSTDLVTFLTSHPQGRLVPPFIVKLACLLDDENQKLHKESAALSKNVDHVKEIIAMQQTYARVSGLVETVQVNDLVEDALRMNNSALDRHGVETIREFAAVPPIPVEKHKVLQILVNLIRNAKYACDESGRPDKRMIMRSANSDGRVKISIIDNGVGIPPENLTRIFGHGFTTRKDGHGFGLHSAANAAKEMGGQLSVHSDGLGRGASFTLELPVALPS
ncbi:MAG: multi-sensor signal transduction histidine kinase [Prosthecobacter sp.]|nr:multi-sensor signal transduction histidine kinase [Prosthecobacter sp.]